MQSIMQLALSIFLLAASAVGAINPLLQKYRPPRQTKAQAKVIANITHFAKAHSSAAKSWVLQYMGSHAVRSRLMPLLQNLSNSQLMERFTWEFQHLPIFHNSPTSNWEATESFLRDDTPINLTVFDRYLQNTCIRETLGGPQMTSDGEPFHYLYSSYFVEMGMPPAAFGNPHWPLRQSNECFLFNSNNLRKTSVGSMLYGAMTWVLNPDTLNDRLFFETCDYGMWKYLSTKGNISYPGFGTRKDWYHLVEAHEAIFNLPYPASWGIPESMCCNYSVADLFNRWWVPGVPPPISGLLLITPYYEIMVAGNVWLPEDLLYGIAKPSNVYGWDKEVRHEGLWGKPAGSKLRDFLSKSQRPLIWSDEDDGIMLIDPKVGGIAGGRISGHDIAVWEDFWQNSTVDASPEQQTQHFRQLASLLPGHLKFNFPSWYTKGACVLEELDHSKMVMGTDANGACVYWEALRRPKRWELLNDGTCESSESLSAPFTTEGECLKVATTIKWSCISLLPIASQSGEAAAYCVPDEEGTFSSVDECESQCVSRGSATLAHNSTNRDIFV